MEARENDWTWQATSSVPWKRRAALNNRNARAHTHARACTHACPQADLGAVQGQQAALCIAEPEGLRPLQLHAVHGGGEGDPLHCHDAGPQALQLDTLICTARAASCN
jgi:hypothetical protein